MAVDCDRLRRLRNYVYTEFLQDNVNVDADMCDGIYDALEELQALQKRHEEMKRGIGAAKKEMRFYIDETGGCTMMKIFEKYIKE